MTARERMLFRALKQAQATLREHGHYIAAANCEGALSVVRKADKGGE